MQQKLLITTIIISSTLSLNAEVKVSISGYDKEDISISTNESGAKGVSVTTDDSGNKNFVYIDKGSSVVDSTIGTSIHVNSGSVSREDRIELYRKKINRYEDKIESYRAKIDKYRNKILDKPKYRDRYEGNIERYEDKIDEYIRKIRESEEKISQYQKDK
ncbi:hypothetical protein GSY74_08350 [Sulfurovum sp. bin170]|uniref:hypothetical protein n=1 Tax=Sulfurovum sp. bin170 TaxID=2695268 RepID=UPI0013DEFFC9|nr:hypothetical protein [Sulfurovum sp. bin170]NEW61292.1 hypothetical protein [Sulfurovum sp. bin170]